MNIFRRQSQPAPALAVAFAPAVNRFLAGRLGMIKVVSATDVRYAGPEGKARLVLNNGTIYGWLLHERRLSRLQWNADHWQSQSRMLNLDDRLWFEDIVEGRVLV